MNANEVVDLSGNSVSTQLLADFAVVVEPALAGFELISLEQVAVRRVNRTVFDYDYAVTLKNLYGRSVHAVAFYLRDLPAGIALQDNIAAFDLLAPGQQLQSGDTITLRADMAEVIDLASVKWGVRSVVPGDFDMSGRVDLLDFSLLAKNWLTDNAVFDIAPTPSGDGVVDMLDMSQLAENWLSVYAGN
ncbi:MAG: hypothetical protein JXM68_04290 [Sedimentisphaerales bacterium]|nr:hypothetical protein [Sedimentisphaerales bacterium]